MSTPYIGEIRMFGGNFAIQGWAFCDGQLLSIAQYEALFNLIGTTYGGDGQNTFAVPDLRGRVPIHQGQASGNPIHVIGELAGAETVTLSTANLPVHSHPLQCVTATGNAASPLNAFPATTSTNDRLYATNPSSTVAMQANLVSQVVGAGNLPHENMQPGLALSFIIALEGIYPSQG